MQTKENSDNDVSEKYLLFFNEILSSQMLRIYGRALNHMFHMQFCLLKEGKFHSRWKTCCFDIRIIHRNQKYNTLFEAFSNYSQYIKRFSYMIILIIIDFKRFLILHYF